MIVRIRLLFFSLCIHSKRDETGQDFFFQIVGLPFPPRSDSHCPTRHYAVKRNLHVNGEKINI